MKELEFVSERVTQLEIELETKAQVEEEKLNLHEECEALQRLVQ